MTGATLNCGDRRVLHTGVCSCRLSLLTGCRNIFGLTRAAQSARFWYDSYHTYQHAVACELVLREKAVPSSGDCLTEIIAAS